MICVNTTLPNGVPTSSASPPIHTQPLAPTTAPRHDAGSSDSLWSGAAALRNEILDGLREIVMRGVKGWSVAADFATVPYPMHAPRCLC